MARTEIHVGSVERLDVLGADGQVDRALVPDLSADRLQAIHGDMEMARAVDERMLKLQRQGRIGTFPPGSGQEACVVGAAHALAEHDWLVGGYRELGARLVRGEPLLNALLYYNGFEEGNVQPEGGPRRLLPINVIVGSQGLHAVGLAYAMRYRGEKAAVLCFVGDGSTSQGDFHEALNFASVWQVPVVFFVQNNGWAISVPLHKQTHGKTLAQRALGYGMPGVQVDGNDVLAVYRATEEALTRAREGRGPTLIEGVTYRLMMHTTADDPSRYRSEQEVDVWRTRDPLPRFRRYLEAQGLWDDARQEALELLHKQQIAEAVTALEAHPAPPDDSPFEHVFETSPPSLQQQRQRFLAERALEASRG